MSENGTESVATESATETVSEAATENHSTTPSDAPQEDSFDADRAKAKIAKANSEAKNLRERVKQLEAYEEQVKKLEDAKKSDIEKATEKLNTAEKRAQEAEQNSMRLQVALDKGLTLTQAKRLVGNTVEELEADADDLLESFAPKTSEAKLPSKPKETLRGGGDPTEEPEEKDPRKLAKLIRRPL